MRDKLLVALTCFETGAAIVMIFVPVIKSAVSSIDAAKVEITRISSHADIV